MGRMNTHRCDSHLTGGGQDNLRQATGSGAHSEKNKMDDDTDSAATNKKSTCLIQNTIQQKQQFHPVVPSSKFSPHLGF